MNIKPEILQYVDVFLSINEIYIIFITKINFESFFLITT